MIRVFLDAGVLIAAFKGEPKIREEAFSILFCPLLDFWYSPLLKLEVTLQAIHHKQVDELRFYDEYFGLANCFGDLNRIFEVGEPDAKRHGIPVMDAMHVAAANLAKCVALVTTEKPTKPLFRTKLVRVVSIAAGQSTDPPPLLQITG
jgi:predicted nucleic acid-binding protein